MNVSVHTAKDPRSADIATYCFAALVESCHVNELPMPEQQNPDFFSELWLSGRIAAAIAWDGDNIVGCRAVALTPSVLNGSSIVATGLVMFVDPRYRANGTVDMLLSSIEQWCQENGVWSMVYVSVPGSRGEKVMLRHKFKMISGFYSKVLRSN